MTQSHADRVKAANEELIDRGNVGAAAEFFTPSYVVHLTAHDQRGPAFVESFVRGLRNAFPDLEVEVEVLACDADRVAWRRTLRATHQAEFHGFPATGRAIVWQDMVVSRFEDGRIAEEWAVSDLAEHLLRR